MEKQHFKNLNGSNFRLKHFGQSSYGKKGFGTNMDLTFGHILKKFGQKYKQLHLL